LVVGSAIGEAVLQTFASVNCAFAQIVPDATLPNNSRVTPSGNTSIIEEGTKAGSNLFHSFEQFSVPTGSTAYFNNAADIQNIISRVTGKSVSNIDGLLRANGTANLFLLNPNGIIFGRNARLDIGGSFVGSTASSLNFADGTQFSATAPQTAPLLTVSVPIGLQYGGNAGGIQNQSRATNSSSKLVGLQVKPGRTLALVGGDVGLDGGILNAQDGRVEIAGVAGPGAVGLFVDGNGLRLSFPDSVARANVYLDNGAEVNVRASGGGSIAINAQNLNLTQGSKLKAGIASGLGLGDTKAGNIEINSTGNVSFNGEGSGAYNQVELKAIGNAGNINVMAGSLSVTNGGELNTSTSGQGNAGNVNVNARDTVSFVGEGPNNISSRAYSRVEKTGVGQGGDIYIKTGSLSVSDGALLSAITFGIGDAGNVTIDARNTVSFVGTGPPADNYFPSGAYASVNTDARGEGGDIYISTGSILVTNGAFLGTRTLGIGNAGNVTINARDTVRFDGVGSIRGRFPYLGSGAYSQVDGTGVGQAGDIYISTGSLEVTGGAYLSAGTLGKGNAGNITINARDKVSFDGVGTNGISSGAYGQARFLNTQGQGGNVNITAGSLSVTNGAILSSNTYGQKNAGNVNINVRDKVSFDGVGTNGVHSGAYSQVQKNAGGNGGSVNITTGSLSVTNGAGLIVSSFGRGDAGDLIINARNTIQLDNQSRIGATTIVGNKGNISLRSQNLVLRRASNITTNATGTATGGNITIDTDILLALENSDITANADVARGGQVRINAQGIFGTEFRKHETPQSDITASSNLGPEFSGTVEINTPDVNPAHGLVNLPAIPIDTKLAQTCQSGGSQAQSEFIITGRGGLPPNPGDALSTDAVQVDLITLNPEVDQPSTTAVSTNSTSPTPARIVEATGWVIDADGNVVLTANASTVTPHNSWQKTADCRAFNQQPGG
jgi:filamentous hemagglutinin family protein